MKKVILIGGDLASGKSTLSDLLVERFGISCFNKDVLKETFAEDIETHNRAENKKLSVASFKVLRYLVRQNVSPMIMESNFKTYEMEELTPILKEHNYDVLSLRLTGDYKVMHKRFMDRLNFTDRNPIHKSQDLSKLEDYIAIIDDLRATKYPGKVIEIDATTFDYQKDEKLFNEIKEFLEK